MNFANLKLYPPLLKSLKELNYDQPTPIQQQTIPAAIDGKDILGCAQTGTGKTAAFALPILDFLGQEQPQRESRGGTALVLAPTRELAIQIGKSFQDYGKHMSFSMALVYGGVNQHQQVKAMKRGVDVLIATPGRLLDLIEQRHIQLGSTEIFVLDEADRMLDMGFLPALRKIIQRLPEQRQSLFFSATLPEKTVDLANRMLFNPVHVEVTPEAKEVKLIEQQVIRLERNEKLPRIRHLLKDDVVDQAIVFTRTKRGANRLSRQLDQSGINNSAIHGNKSQNARQKALEQFRQGRISVLVATDVASRGIDIDGISHVINYDMPVDPESYVHRIGRTGRAGREGVAISFCAPDERSELQAIERLLGKRIPMLGEASSEVRPEKGRSENRPQQKRKPGNRNRTRRKEHSRQEGASQQKRKSGQSRRKRPAMA